MLREFPYSTEIHFIESFTIVIDFDFIEIEDFSKRREIFFGVCSSFFSFEHWSFSVFIATITYLSSRITYENDNIVSEFLKFSELQDRNSMTDMDDRCRRVDTEFDTKLFTAFEAFDEIFFIYNTGDSFCEKVLKRFYHRTIMRKM